MGAHVDIDGHPTWVEDRGGLGEPIVLLHGGLSNSDALLDSIGPGLATRYRTVAFDRRGHGRTADTDAAFHYSDMATETVRILEEVVREPAHLVGWSDGGIVALLVALARPDLVRKLVVIGTNFHHDGLVQFEPDLQTPFFQTIIAAYLERSPDGPDHLEEFFAKTFAMFASEPTMTTDEIAHITHPVLVVSGDDDLIRLDHTCSLYQALPVGQLAVVPGASHGLPIEQPEFIVGLVVNFLAATEPPHTLIPMRR